MATKPKKAAIAGANAKGQAGKVAKSVGGVFKKGPSVEERIDQMFGSGTAARSGVGKGGDNELDKLTRYLKDEKKNNQNFLKSYVTPKLDALDAAGQAATAGDQMTNLARYNTTAGTTAEMDRAYQQLASGFGTYKAGQDALDQSDLDELARYKSQIPGLRDQIAGLEWKDVKSGGPGYEAQLDALNKLKGLTTPEMTAQERFLMEQGRRQQEQQERSSRDAVMQDLAARGMRSAGAELTNMLGARQQTSQNRVMSNLGAQANAVDRSMRALEGYGTTAGQMRTADDAIAMFNGQQGQLAREEMQKRYQGLNKEEADMTTGVNKGVGERRHQTWGEEKGVANARNMNALSKDQLWDRWFGNQDQYVDKAYGRTKDSANAWMDYGGMYTAGSRADTAPVANVATAKYGSDQAAKAAAALNKKGPLDMLNPFSWFSG